MLGQVRSVYVRLFLARSCPIQLGHVRTGRVSLFTVVQARTCYIRLLKVTTIYVSLGQDRSG
jgi:hypothetical protein